MNVCIPQDKVVKLKALIDSGEVSVQDIKKFKSEERVEFFSKYMDEDLAKKLNTGFEQRINSDTKDILEKYIERELTKVPIEVKKDLTSRLMKMNDLLSPDKSDQFLDELVAHKLGVYIDPMTAGRVLKFAEKANDLKSKIKDSIVDIKSSVTGKPQYVKYTDEEIKALSEQKKYSSQEIEEIKKKNVKYTDEEIKALSEEKRYSSEEIETIRKQNSYTDKEIKELPNQKKYSSREIESMKRRGGYTDNEIKALSEEKKYSSQEIEEIKKRNTYSDKQIEVLSKQKKYSREGIEAIKKQNIKYTDSEIEVLSKEKKYSSQEIEEIKKRNSYTDKEIGEIFEQRLAYGRAQYDVKTYLEEVLKTRKAATPSPDGVIPKAWHYFAKGVSEFGSVTKAVKATLDNSLFGRQGWKVFTTDPKIWAKNFAKSWGDIAGSWADLKKSRRLMDADGNPTEFFYENVMRETYADVISRPNALTGKYQAASNEYGLGVSAEELFPKLFDYTADSKMEMVFGNKITNIPVRLHKGFENAFSAGALRMRADLADGLIRNLEAKGVNVMDKKVANVLGEFVSSFTGRGEIGKLASIGNELGTVLFSPRFLKSQVDTALHPFKIATKSGAFKDVPDEVRKAIAKKYIRYIGLNASLLAMLDFAEVTSLDPRSDAFGYLVIGDRKYDMTGGARGLFALAAKMLSDERKDYTTGRTYLASDKYGYSKSDELVNFFAGKRAPALSITWSLLFGTGTNFDGYQIRPTDGQSVKNLVNELFVPITVDTWIDMAKFDEPTWIQGGLAEFIGVSNRAQVNRPNYGKWQDLLNSNEDQYKKAVDEYNAELWKLVRKTKGNPQYTKMSDKDLSEFYTNKISDIRTDIIEKYDRHIDKKFKKKD